MSIDPRALAWFYLFTGLVFLVTQSGIGVVLRVPLARRSVWLRMLLYCPACVGAWVNLVLSLLGAVPLTSDFAWPMRALVGVTAGMTLGLIWGAIQRALVGEGNTAWELEKGLYDVEEPGPDAGGS